MRPQTGGNISQTADHVTDSNLAVAIPVGNTELKSCDYIKIVENGITVFAGTILGIKQQNHGYSPDLTDKYFELTIASNAQLTSKVYVDMQFPAGATVTQVLKGNHVGDAWYNSALGEFYGIIPIRVNAEGITTGTIDDFSSITLSDVAFLWGQTVNDVLDTICATAGAWWEITPDRVFNMRFNVSHDSAPFVLDGNLKAYDLEPTSDAYTTYSAVRVVGGKGKGNAKSPKQYISGQHNFEYGEVEIIDDTHLKVKYPIGSITSPIHQHSTANSADLMWFVGFNGIDDDNSNYQALTSYGSDTITLKSNATKFIALPSTKDINEWITLYYYPIIPILTRLVDPNLSAEIKAQRGGTGVVEYVLKDDTITDFSVASQTAMQFLQENAKHTDSIKFKTLVFGFEVGQLLQGDIPYYGVSGEYLITAVTATTTSGTDGIVWEYQIEASTSAYRNSLKGLFYSMKKISFKLGDEFPANDGLYLNSEILIKSELEIRAIQPKTWAELDLLNHTWAELDLLNRTWKEIENTIKECDLMGNYLTPIAKSIITGLLSGNALVAGKLATNTLFLIDSSENVVKMLDPIGAQTVGIDNIVRNYYVDEEVQAAIVAGNVYNSPTGLTQVVQSIPLNIDKSATNPLGPYALTIVKKDTVI